MKSHYKGELRRKPMSSGKHQTTFYFTQRHPTHPTYVTGLPGIHRGPTIVKNTKVRPFTGESKTPSAPATPISQTGSNAAMYRLPVFEEKYAV